MDPLSDPRIVGLLQRLRTLTGVERARMEAARRADRHWPEAWRTARAAVAAAGREQHWQSVRAVAEPSGWGPLLGLLADDLLDAAARERLAAPWRAAVGTPGGGL